MSISKSLDSCVKWLDLRGSIFSRLVGRNWEIFRCVWSFVYDFFFVVFTPRGSFQPTFQLLLRDGCTQTRRINSQICRAIRCVVISFGFHQLPASDKDLKTNYQLLLALMNGISSSVRGEQQPNSRYSWWEMYLHYIVAFINKSLPGPAWAFHTIDPCCS